MVAPETRADAHHRDKLNRWRENPVSGAPPGPEVYA